MTLQAGSFYKSYPQRPRDSSVPTPRFHAAARVLCMAVINATRVAACCCSPSAAAAASSSSSAAARQPRAAAARARAGPAGAVPAVSVVEVEAGHAQLELVQLEVMAGGPGALPWPSRSECGGSDLAPSLGPQRLRGPFVGTRATFCPQHQHLHPATWGARPDLRITQENG